MNNTLFLKQGKIGRLQIVVNPLLEVYKPLDAEKQDFEIETEIDDR